MSDKSDYKKYNQKVCKNANSVPSHEVIANYIKKNGEDYRVQVSPHPVSVLSNRKEDNTSFAR